MTRTTSFLVLVVTVGAVAAVGVSAVGGSTTASSSDSVDQTGGQTDDIRVRIVHASPDAPPVDVSVDGQVVASELAFGEEAAVPVEEAGSYSVEIAAVGNESAVLFAENVTLAAGTDYTIAAAGEVTEGAPTAFEPLVIAENATAPDTGEAAVSLVHLSPDAPAVDVTESTTGEVVFENVGYRNTTEPVTLPAGDYTLDVRVESESNDGEIVESFDVSLASETSYTAFAIGYVGENASADRAFTLLLSEDDGAGDGMNATETPTAAGPMTEAPTTAGPMNETPTDTAGPNS